MIINYLHIVSVIRPPIKTNSPLVIDANTVLSGASADEFLQTVRRRNAQIINRFGVTYHSQFSQGDLLYVGRQFARAREIMDFLGFGIFERFNHAKRLWRNVLNVKNFIFQFSKLVFYLYQSFQKKRNLYLCIGTTQHRPSILIVPYGFNSSWLCHENKEKRLFRFNSSRLCREKNLIFLIRFRFRRQ